ncbi:uncharacterized protein J8A68_000876 [[Candida] subhashii]|uniref:Uncharacterized protein n=1 Tax=[Candida] subhashii TaxID=561895 RepID=A0A8J5QU35_9ASCO|nr:uncharacterized protein J8A68_000876 [[Candida] subhashii]KAG7665670.1 hypothetical protein J8A68_000876 [[Candida] subhashii]
MKLSNIIYASIIAGAAAEEFFPFKVFLKGNRLSKRSCNDCYDAEEIQLDHCPANLVYDTDKRIELLDCLCDLPIQYFEKLVDCMSDCEQILLLETTTFDAEDLKWTYCDGAEQIKTYTGDLADYTYSPEEENANTVIPAGPKTNVSNSTVPRSTMESPSSSTTSSNNSAATLGFVSAFALFALSML